MNIVQLAATMIIPILVALFSSPKWPGGVRAFLAFALCVVLAIFQARGQFGPDVVENVLKVFIAVQGLYLGLLKHIGLPALERGSADAWRALLETVSEGLSGSGYEEDSELKDTSSKPSAEVRIETLDRLLAANRITQEQYEARMNAILEAI